MELHIPAAFGIAMGSRGGWRVHHWGLRCSEGAWCIRYSVGGISVGMTRAGRCACRVARAGVRMVPRVPGQKAGGFDTAG